MNKTSDKLYVYLNHRKIVDQTVQQFFDEQAGGRSFSEFTKSIIYHYALANGYQAKLSVATAPPPPAMGKIISSGNKKRIKKKHSVKSAKGESIKHKSKDASEADVYTDGEELASSIPPTDSMDDDIRTAVNLIL